MKFTFFKVASHRTFHHEPIYYDEAREKRLERERKAREELGLLSDKEAGSGYADRIKGGFNRKIKPHYEVARSIKRRSNVRLVIILFALMLLAYYLVESGQEWYAELIGK